MDRKILNFDEYISDIIRSILTDLNGLEFSLIVKYVQNIIKLIRYKFNVTDEDIDKYIDKFKENDNRNIIAVLYLLLPYIDDKNDFELFKKIKSFDDIYCKKKSNYINNPYEISNIQYNRCIRKIINNNLEAEEIHFDAKHLEQNYLLLCRSIDRMSNKLYVNWINIRPITLKDYKEENVYIKTIDLYKGNNLTRWDKLDKLDMITQLYIGDIYDTIYNILYLEIKQYKWLLFETIIDKELYLYLELLNKIFPLDDIIGETPWLLLTNEQIQKYNTTWTDILDAVKSNKSYKIPNDKITLLIKQLIIYFETHSNQSILRELINNNMYIKLDSYTDIKKEISNIKQFINLEKDDMEDDMDNKKNTLDQIQQLDIKYFIESIEKLPIEYIYTFLYNQINEFKSTWYAQHIFKNNLINKNFEFYTEDFNKFKNEADLPQDIDFKLSLKNIYNYCKSFCHIGQDYQLLPHKWIMLNDNHQINILSRLNTKTNNSEWFSIKGNLRKIYPNLEKIQIESLNNVIFNTIHTNIIDIVFQALIHKGLLTKLHFDKELTNHKLMPEKLEEKNIWYTKKLYELVFNKKNREKYENTNYFLTTKPYKSLDYLRVDKSIVSKYDIKYIDVPNSIITGKELVDIPYFDSLAITYAWYKSYAMDWICQISFFHHYINNSVMYITGATGQGKSTQVPKLFLYALKMLDSKMNGKAICTAPRVDPTVENATRIAEEMGVPLDMPVGNQQGNIRTSNYYIQYAYQEDNHSIKDAPYFLRICTDGKLIEEISKNIILKDQIPVQIPVQQVQTRDNNLLYNEFMYSQSGSNIYDIVMIDESHEHNTNMDLILTLGRNIVTYNNSIKLIIISATIDDDEPIYRRYYRDVNDNLIYPYTYELNTLDLDRVNVDRRYHIAPPGMTTQFEVTDIWKKDIKYPDNPKQAYELAEQYAINTVEDICESNLKGEILFFSIGEAEIKRIFEELLQRTPKHILIIPYLAKVNKVWKSKIPKIGNQLSSITFHRKHIYDVIFTDIIPDNIEKVPEGTYKNAIIIATTVAEASITIDTLRYVIDTGFAKTSKFNPLLGTTELKIGMITESSRIQRRGRVGRVNEGIVYYMYDVDDRKNVPLEYKICNDDIRENMNKLIASSHKNVSIRAYIEHLIEKQFKYYDTNDIIYKGNNYDDIPIKYKKISDYYIDGYKIEDVMDIEGRFYIIHPRENLSKRNILTGMIEKTFNTSEGKFVDAGVMNVLDLKIMLDDLMFTQRIIDLNVFDEIDYLSEHANKLGLIFTEFQKMEFNKTQISYAIGDIMKDISSNDITYDIIMTLIYAIKYNVYEEILIIIVSLLACQNSLKNIISDSISEKGIPIKNFDNFKKLYNNNDSDYIIFLQIFNKFKESFKDSVIFKNTIDINSIIKEYNDDRLAFIDIKKNQKYNNMIPTDYDVKKYNKYNAYLHNNILANELGIKDIINKSKKNNKNFDKLEEELIKNKALLDSWCQNNCINPIIFNKIIKEYYSTKTMLLSVIDSEQTKKMTLNLLAQKIPVDIIDKDDNTKIIKCFFQSIGKHLKFGYYLKAVKEQSFKHITNIPYFYLINQSGQHLIARAKSITKASYNKESTLDTFSPLIMYHSSEVFFDETKNKDVIELSIISKVNNEWFTTLLPHIFNRKVTRISNTKYDTVNKSGEEVLNYFNINNISYLKNIDDKILKKYYDNFVLKINNLFGGYNKSKYYSFSSNKLKANKKLESIVSSYKYNIKNLLNEIHVKLNGNNIMEMYGKDSIGFVHKFL